MKKITCMLSMLLMLISANAQTLRGDVNGDGKVDASDVSDLVTIILNAGLTEDDIYKKYNTPAISWIDDDFAAFDFCTTPTTPKAGTTAMPSTRTMPARLRLRRSTASRRSNSTDSTPHLSSCGQATQQSSPTICPS